MTILVMKWTAETECYRWRRLNDRSEWSGEANDSSLESLTAQWPGARVVLLVDGKEAVIRQMAFTKKEKRHLARLIPYQLEGDIVSDVDSLHVAIGVPGDKTVPVVYMSRKSVKERIDALEQVGFRVQQCFVESQLLMGSVDQWVLSLGQQGQVNFSSAIMTTSCDMEMMPLLLSSLMSNPAFQPPQEIILRAYDDAGTRQLKSFLSQVLSEPVNITDILQKDSWDALRLTKLSQVVNLRQGELAPPLRLYQHWPTFRVSTVAALIALLLFTAVSVTETYRNNVEYKNIQLAIEQAYRSAVPQGVLVDAEQQLRSQLSRFRGQAGQEKMMPMLDKVAPFLLQGNSVQVHRLGFNATANELQLAITADSNADILAFSESLNRAGLPAQARNLNRSGDRQQASLTIGGEQ